MEHDSQTDGLFVPASVTWKVSRENILLAGGMSAAILQVAHPSVAHGVNQYSNFRESPLRRLHNTLLAVHTVAFGQREAVEKIRTHIAQIHLRVKGDLPGKRPYSAFDPDAQLWVLATLFQTSVFLYERWILPLSEQEKDSYWKEYRIFGEIFGLEPAYGPQSWEAFCIYYEEMITGDLLGSDPLSAKVAQAIAFPSQPFWVVPVGTLLHFTVNEFLPSPLRERLGFHSNSRTRAALRLADRLVPSLIAALPATLRFNKAYRQAVKRSCEWKAAS
ncbi:MAG: oxygenase MpaB family protein [Chthoniobacterales bacterium]